MSGTIVNLDELIRSDSDLPIKKFEYFEDNSLFKIEIEALSNVDRDQFNSLIKKNTVGLLYNGKTTKAFNVYGDLILKCIKGWENLRAYDLVHVIPFKTGIGVDQLKQSIIEFSVDTLKKWCEKDDEFSLWIVNTAAKIAEFQTDSDLERLKKSSESTSPEQS